ncbi:hypothetical protein [uncultured Lacinutrix sp.]|uniref:hypothetical protein n=1 Tax=uncultured Lacinutrix sp. TaxID=574032 RepID=UPI00262828D3|nr:hypothetical protein [uncultured Lacinutrix sp.]
MAPIKFEENLKEKLEQRTITPSANSWDALANKLDAKEKKKGINNKLWLSIAASFIGVVFMYNMFFMSSDKSNVKENVTDIETKAIETNKNVEKEAILQDGIKNEIVLETVEEKKVEIKDTTVEQIKSDSNHLASTKTVNNKQKKSKDVKSNIIGNKSNKNNNNAYYVLNETNNGLEKGIKKQSIVLNEKAVAISQKEIIEITDSELDALLNNAKNKIVKNQPKNTIPLDYNELLQDVEDDLEETFRDKLLKTVKGGYRTVKTYVAERNE